MNATKELIASAPSGFQEPGFLADLRLQMVKFAALQLSDPHAAEDAVQEALVGALKNERSFGGRAAFKTWVFAILKHKIADALRRRQRIPEALAVSRDDEDGEEMAALFDETGHWRDAEAPENWSASANDPEHALRSSEFWLVFETCLDRLPVKQARVFMMREFVELEVEEICASAEVSLSNVHVLLHRARLRLRECLENRWFAAGELPC